MSDEPKNNFGLSDKMNQLIRETVKTAINEGYSVATIKNVILEEFKANLDEGKLSNFEIKLFELFNKGDPRRTRLTRKHFAMLCSAYYDAREAGRSFDAIKLGEIAATVAKRLRLKETSLNGEIRILSYYLRCTFLNFMAGYSKEVLEAFYQNYMKNL